MWIVNLIVLAGINFGFFVYYIISSMKADKREY